MRVAEGARELCEGARFRARSSFTSPHSGLARGGAQGPLKRLQAEGRGGIPVGGQAVKGRDSEDKGRGRRGRRVRAFSLSALCLRPSLAGSMASSALSLSIGARPGASLWRARSATPSATPLALRSGPRQVPVRTPGAGEKIGACNLQGGSALLSPRRSTQAHILSSSRGVLMALLDKDETEYVCNRAYSSIQSIQ